LSLWLKKVPNTSQHTASEVFWGHGTRDEVLHPDLQDEGVEILQQAGLKVTSKKLCQQAES